MHQQCWVDIGTGKVVERIHPMQFTAQAPCLQAPRLMSQPPLGRRQHRQALPVHAGD